MFFDDDEGGGRRGGGGGGGSGRRGGRDPSKSSVVADARKKRAERERQRKGERAVVALQAAARARRSFDRLRKQQLSVFNQRLQDAAKLKAVFGQLKRPLPLAPLVAMAPPLLLCLRSSRRSPKAVSSEYLVLILALLSLLKGSIPQLEQLLGGGGGGGSGGDAAAAAAASVLERVGVACVRQLNLMAATSPQVAGGTSSVHERLFADSDSSGEEDEGQDQGGGGGGGQAAPSQSHERARDAMVSYMLAWLPQLSPEARAAAVAKLMSAGLMRWVLLATSAELGGHGALNFGSAAMALDLDNDAIRGQRLAQLFALGLASCALDGGRVDVYAGDSAAGGVAGGGGSGDHGGSGASFGVDWLGLDGRLCEAISGPASALIEQYPDWLGTLLLKVDWADVAASAITRTLASSSASASASSSASPSPASLPTAPSSGSSDPPLPPPSSSTTGLAGPDFWPTATPCASFTSHDWHRLRLRCASNARSLAVMRALRVWTSGVTLEGTLGGTLGGDADGVGDGVGVGNGSAAAMSPEGGVAAALLERARTHLLRRYNGAAFTDAGRLLQLVGGERASEQGAGDEGGAGGSDGGGGEVAYDEARRLELVKLRAQRRRQLNMLCCEAKVCGWGVYCCDFLLLPITSYCS